MGFLDKLFRKSKEMDHMSNVKLAVVFYSYKKLQLILHLTYDPAPLIF